MIKWIYTDSPEEQNESVTSKRNFYIGGSELNKIFEDFYKGDIIQNIFEKLCYIDTSHGVQPDWATFGHKAEEIIRDYVNRKFGRNYRPAVSINESKQSRTNVDGYDKSEMFNASNIYNKNELTMWLHVADFIATYKDRKVI